MIIGQNNNISLIKQLKMEMNLKPFILISGPKNSGKKYLCKEIANILNYSYMFIDSSINDIREMIKEAYTRQLNRLFIIPNIEDLNFRAQEAILKITEEPPVGCILVGTSNNIDLLKPTLKNRAYIIRMEKYSKEDLINYSIKKKYDIADKSLIGNVIYSPTLIDYYFEDNNNRYKKYKSELKKWFENICIISAGNALKAVSLFNIKSDKTEGIEFDNFLLWLSESMTSNSIYKFARCLAELSLLCLSYRNQYNYNGINKEHLIKDFIIKFRQTSKKYEFNGFTKPD